MKPGNTPLVEFRELAPTGTRLFAKLEWYNPTGSIKDRPAWRMFHQAVDEGKLLPGMPLIEATSGNTGIGLARIALINKHPMTICLPAKSTEERKQLLRAYGADLVEVDGGPNDAIAYARHLVDEGHGYMCYQYGNPANPASHEFGTSLEIQRDWPLEAPPDHLFCAYGTGGTLTGNSRAMKRFHPAIQVHGGSPSFPFMCVSLQALLQARLHEWIERAIEHGGGVAGLDAGAEVLDAGLIEYVRTDLVPPADIGLLVFEHPRGGIALVDFELVELGLQHLHRGRAVAESLFQGDWAASPDRSRGMR
jgi:cysteine synthase B